VRGSKPCAYDGIGPDNVPEPLHCVLLCDLSLWLCSQLQSGRGEQAVEEPHDPDDGSL